MKSRVFAPLLVAVALVATACAGMDPLPRSVSAIVASVTQGAQVDHPDGAMLTVPDGAAPDGSRATVARLATPPPPPPAVQLVGPAFDASVSGDLSGLVTLVLPVDPSLVGPDPDLVRAFRFDDEEGRWLLVGGEYRPDLQAVVIQTDHLSRWVAGRVILDQVEAFVMGLFDGIFGTPVFDVGTPDCAGSTDGFEAEQVAGVGLRWCAGSLPDGTPTLRVRSDRQYTMGVLTGPDMSVTRSPGFTGSIASLGHKLTERMEESFRADRNVSYALLTTGREIQVAVLAEPETTTSLLTEVNSGAYLLDVLDVAVQALMLVLGASKAKALADATLDGACFGAQVLGRDGFTAAVDDGDARATGVNLVELTLGCFGDHLGSVFGIFANAVRSVLVVIVGLIVGLVAGVQGLVDLLSGNGNGRIDVTIGEEPVRRPSVTITRDGWPDHLNNAPSVIWVFFGANFIAPRWVSCSPDYCIAGDSETVHFVDRSPLRIRVSFPRALNPPQESLEFLEVPPDQIDVLLGRASP